MGVHKGIRTNDFNFLDGVIQKLSSSYGGKYGNSKTSFIKHFRYPENSNIRHFGKTSLFELHIAPKCLLLKMLHNWNFFYRFCRFFNFRSMVFNIKPRIKSNSYFKWIRRLHWLFTFRLQGFGWFLLPTQNILGRWINKIYTTYVEFNHKSGRWRYTDFIWRTDTRRFGATENSAFGHQWRRNFESIA